MTDELLTEEEFQFFNQLEQGDLVDVVTRDGEDHTIKIESLDGRTATGVYTDEGPYDLVLIKLLGDRGRGDDEDQPYIAIGYDQNDALTPVLANYDDDEPNPPRPSNKARDHEINPDLDEEIEDQDITDLGDVVVGGVGPVKINEDQANIEHSTELISIEEYTIPEHLQKHLSEKE